VGKLFIDLTGKRFGHLYVIKRVKNNKWDHHAQFLTRCEIDNCGNEKVVSGSRLTSKNEPMTHCGCLTSQNISIARKGSTNGSYKHGQHGTKEYKSEYDHIRRIKLKNLLISSLAYQGSLKQSRNKLNYCGYCGSTDNLCTDHIIPISKGGNNDIKNLVTSCRYCNSSKSNLFFIDWYLKTTRVKRKLDDILKDMGFDSLIHLRNYQDSMCPEHIEQDPDVRFRKLVKATSKDMEFLESYYRSLL